MKRSSEFQKQRQALAEDRALGVLRTLLDLAEDKTTPSSLRIKAASSALSFLLPRQEELSVAGADGEALPTLVNVSLSHTLMRDSHSRKLVEDFFLKEAERDRERRKLLEIAAQPTESEG
jgi:hypothetical protein